MTPTANIRHGTRSGYRYWKCRCPLCQAWNTAESKRYWRERERRTGQGRPNGWSAYNQKINYG